MGIIDHLKNFIRSLYVYRSEDITVSMSNTAAVVYLLMALLISVQAGLDLNIDSGHDQLMLSFSVAFCVVALIILLYPWFKYFSASKYVFVALTIVMIATLSYFTGGHQSSFIFFFIPIGIWSALFLNRSSVIALNVITILSVYFMHYISDLSLVPSMRVFTVALLAIVSSAIVSYLIGQLRDTLREKDASYAELESYNMSLQNFDEFLKEVRGEFNLEKAYERVFKAISELMSFENCYLYLLSGTKLSVVAGLNIDQEIIEKVSVDLSSPDSEVCLVSDVLRTGEFANIRDLESVELIDPLIYSKHPFKSAGCLVLNYGSEKLGVLLATSKESKIYTDRDLKLIRMISDELSRAIVMSRTYAELRHLKEVYENIVDSANDMIITANSEGKIQIANQSACELSGYDLFELEGAYVWDLFSSSKEGEVRGYFDQITRGIRLTPKAFNFKTKSGDQLVIEVTSSKAVDHSDTGFQILGRNITERKKLLEEIVRHNNKLIALNKIAATLNRMPDGDHFDNQMLISVIGALDLDLGAIYLINDTYDQIKLRTHFGFKENFAKELGAKFITAQSTRRFVTQDKMLLLHGSDINKELDIAIDDICTDATFMFIQIRDKSKLIGVIMLGSYKNLDQDAYDDDLLRNVGNQIGIQIVNYELLNELKESEARYRMTIENAADGIFIVDEEGVVIEVNNKMLELTGYAGAEIISKSLPDLFADESGREIFNKLKRHGRWSGELQLRQRSGLVLEAEMDARTQEYRGHRSFQGIIRDITEKKELARLLERENEELKLLNEVFNVSTQSLELTKVVPTFTQKVTDFFHNKVILLYLYDESAMSLELISQIGIPQDSQSMIARVPIKGSVVGQVFLTKLPVHIESDLESDPRASRQLKDVLAQAEIESIHSFPVTTMQKTIGVIQLGFSQRTVLSEADKKVISLISGRLGSMVENSKLYEHEKKRSLELETVDGLTKVASSTLNLNEMLRRILDRLIELTGAELGAVLLKDTGSSYLHVKVGQGLSEEVYVSIEGKIGEGLCGIAFNTGEILIVDPRNKYEFLHISDYGFKTQIAVPLISRSDPLGVIYLAARKDISITTDTKHLLKQISDNVAMTVQNALLFASQKDSTEKLKLFNKIASEIGTSFDLESIFHHASQSIVGNLDVGCSHIWVVRSCDKEATCRLKNVCGNQSSCLHLLVQNGTSCVLENKIDRVPLGKFDVGIVAVTKRSVINNNPQENPLSIDAEWVKREGFKSFGAYPIIVDDQVVGVLDTYNFFPIEKDIDEVMLFIAKDLAVAIKNANLFNELNYEKNKVETIMKDLADGVVITDASEKILTYNNGAMQIMGYKEKEVLGKYCWDVFKGVNEDGNAVCKKDCYPMRHIRQGNDTLKFDMKVTDVAGDSKWIRTNLSAQRDDKGNVLSLIRVFQDVTETKELEILALVDELTKLKNRRYLMTRMKEELASVKRNHYSLACAMIDIDKFKSVNDTYGHSIGDDVLKSVARTLQDVARTTDIVARFGGEEFCVLLPYTSLEGAQIFAEKLRSEVEQNILYIENYEIRSTISIGLSATDNIDVKTGKKLIEDADKALYQAKETGRNRVCVTESTVKKTK